MSVYHAARDTTVERQCGNPDCPECNVVKELSAFQELGAVFLCNDDDVYCRECGEEMVNVP
jgi:hypothetical protein